MDPLSYLCEASVVVVVHCVSNLCRQLMKVDQFDFKVFQYFIILLVVFQDSLQYMYDYCSSSTGLY